MLCHDSSCSILTNLALFRCSYFGSGARMSGSTGSVIFFSFDILGSAGR